jgi:hypothetical protein
MEKLKRNTKDGAISVSVVTRLRDRPRWQRVSISRKGNNCLSLFQCFETKTDAQPISLSMGTAGRTQEESDPPGHQNSDSPPSIVNI